MSAELDNLRKEHEKFKARMTRIENPLERVGRLQDELSQLEVSSTSASGKVTVVAGPGGAVRDVRFTDDAVGQPAAALAAEVLSTLHQAVAAAARKQAEIVDGHTGGQLNAYQTVLQNQADAFGTSVEELTASVEAPAAPERVRNDDDFSENTLMSKEHRAAPDAGPPSGGSSRADEFLKNLFDEDQP